MDSNEIKEFF